MKCDYCELERGHLNVIYEDEMAVAVIKDTAVLPGQVTIFPRQHFTIMEMVPNDILRHCIVLANKVGIAVFDALEAQGTNILIQNGLSAGQNVPHFGIEVIPRREADGLNFQWQSKQLTEDELELLFQELEEGKKAKPKEIVAAVSENGVEKGKGSENYLIKSLRRLP